MGGISQLLYTQYTFLYKLVCNNKLWCIWNITSMCWLPSWETARSIEIRHYTSEQTWLGLLIQINALCNVPFIVYLRSRNNSSVSMIVHINREKVSAKISPLYQVIYAPLSIILLVFAGFAHIMFRAAHGNVT